mmetsp:Transcript_35271/g.110210  ORF Transcript_35271/g.110210 Transcript_35271/m.110210 type:complete len:224 (-) Transcript_35271:334-1005(-)
MLSLIPPRLQTLPPGFRGDAHCALYVARTSSFRSFFDQLLILQPPPSDLIVQLRRLRLCYSQFFNILSLQLFHACKVDVSLMRKASFAGQASLLDPQQKFFLQWRSEAVLLLTTRLMWLDLTLGYWTLSSPCLIFLQADRPGLNSFLDKLIDLTAGWRFFNHQEPRCLTLSRTQSCVELPCLREGNPHVNQIGNGSAMLYQLVDRLVFSSNRVLCLQSRFIQA